MLLPRSLLLPGEERRSRALNESCPKLPKSISLTASVRNLFPQSSQLAHNRLATLLPPAQLTTLFLLLSPGRPPLGRLCTPHPAPATASALSKQRSTWVRTPAASQPGIPPPEAGGSAAIGQHAQGALGATSPPPPAAGRSASRFQARPSPRQLPREPPPRGRTLFTHDTPSDGQRHFRQLLLPLGGRPKTTNPGA